MQLVGLWINLQVAARAQAVAVHRAGAAFEELEAVVNLAYLLRSLSVANPGGQMILGLALDTEDG